MIPTQPLPSRSTVQLTATLGVLGFAGIAIGFLFHWYLITTLGPGRATDALFAAMAVPQLALTALGGSLTAVLVPILSSETDAAGRSTAWTYFHAVLLASALIGFVLGLSASSWARFTFPGFDSETLGQVVVLVRIQLITMVLSALSLVLMGIHAARGRFLRMESLVLASSLIGLFSLVLLLPRAGIVGAAWALLVRAGAELFFLIPILGRYMPPDFRSESLREGGRRLRPLLAGSLYYRLGPLVDRFWTSLAPAGDLTLLHLGGQIYGGAHQVLGKAITTPALPTLARYAHAGDFTSYRRASSRRVAFVLLVTCSGMVGLVLIGEPALRMLFGFRNFSDDSTYRLWVILIALGGVWVAGGLGQILASGFYALGDTIIPTRVGVVGFTLGIGLKILGFYFCGVIGIAIGTSAYYVLNAILLHIFLKRSISFRSSHT
jgi:putative peptidoglycan lipid II flippase